MGLLFDFKRLKIKSSFVKLSKFSILLNLAISCNSSIDLFCSSSALLKSFFLFFFFNNFLWLLSTLRLLSNLLRVFNNSSVQIFWGSLIPPFFAIRLYSFLVNSSQFLYYTKTENFFFYIFKKLIILIIKIYMQWLCILL